MKQRDIAAVRFAYEGDRYCWQLALLNDSGQDWWGIGDRWGLMSPDRLPPQLGQLHAGGACDGQVVYSYNATTQQCSIRAFDPALRRPGLIGTFEARFVDGSSGVSQRTFVRDMAPRVLGTTTLEGAECVVIAGVSQPQRGEAPLPGTNQPPDERLFQSIQRLWISPDRGFAVLRWESVTTLAGEPTSCAVRRAYSWRQYADGLWVPQVVEEDCFALSEGRLAWDCTKRFRLRELTLNEPIEFSIADYMFPLDYDSLNNISRRPLWDRPSTIAHEGEQSPIPPPDPLGDEVLRHAAQLTTWMMQIPGQ